MKQRTVGLQRDSCAGFCGLRGENPVWTACLKNTSSRFTQCILHNCRFEARIPGAIMSWWKLNFIFCICHKIEQMRWQEQLFAFWLLPFFAFHTSNFSEGKTAPCRFHRKKRGVFNFEFSIFCIRQIHENTRKTENTKNTRNMNREHKTAG